MTTFHSFSLFVFRFSWKVPPSSSIDQNCRKQNWIDEVFRGQFKVKIQFPYFKSTIVINSLIRFSQSKCQSQCDIKMFKLDLNHAESKKYWPNLESKWILSEIRESTSFLEGSTNCERNLASFFWHSVWSSFHQIQKKRKRKG